MLFFISTLFLSLHSERIFVSPDENAAFVFARQLVDVGSLSVRESYNSQVGGLIHPRSVAVLGDLLVPGSFLGLPITAGILMLGFGDAGGLLLTPVLALLGILAFRVVIWKMFDDKSLADVSALFLMVHPAYLYFSGRVMMHNVAFLAFLIFAAFFAVSRPFGHKSLFVREFRRLEHALAGIFVGLALFFRLSEAVWVLPVAFGLLIAFRNNLGWRNIASFLGGLLLMGVVIGYANSWVFGSPLLTGYTLPPVPTVASADVAISSAENAPSFALPFSFHPRAILNNVWDYGFVLYPWLTLASLLGFGLLVLRGFEKNTAWRTLTVVSIIVSGVLFSLYGSWNFFDNPDPTLITIGNSHVRYWLPVFALSTPFAAYLFVRVWRFFDPSLVTDAAGAVVKEPTGAKLARVSARTLLVFILLFGLTANVHLVIFGHDGVLATRDALDSFIGKRARIMTLTEAESVIVVDRADKYLFPYRRVMVPLRDDKTYNALPVLVKTVPTYYFGITFPETDLAYLNNDKLKALGLKIELVETIREESLYKFSHASGTSR